MTPFAADSIEQPTLLVDKRKARANILKMAEKARRSGVRFRPHFKTHQSADIGEWYREEGVTAITVSSLDMAAYFADHGWNDITVAFPVNIREIGKINALASRITLHIVVQSTETVAFLLQRLTANVHVWIKVDVGYHRAGMDPGNRSAILAVGEKMKGSEYMQWAGLLAHAGHSYDMRSASDIKGLFRDAAATLNDIRETLADEGFPGLQLSVGDTPGCSLAEDFSGVDEIRAGNFVFYDVTQCVIGSCTPDQIAVAMACPVVALYPERGEALIYGGGVHLSKDVVQIEGSPCYGWVTDINGGQWGTCDKHEKVKKLSQEHGIVKVRPERMAKLQVGDLLYILPVHSCMTVDLMRRYVEITEGGRIEAGKY